MNKVLIAVAAAFFALTALFGSGAEAGFNVRLAAPDGFSSVHKAGGCGGGGYRRSFRRHRSVSRRVQRKVYIAKKPAAEEVSVAKTDDKAEDKAEAKTQVAKTENSSLSGAGDQVAEENGEKTEEKVVAAKDLGCKQFFPAVGMTLSVSCE